jgi:hypothetical protein
MLMLTPSNAVPGCYNLTLGDAATDGSKTQVMKNVWESASVLDSWETSFAKAAEVLKSFGQEVDTTEAENNVKHFYQTIRHGMCFDWMLNHICCKIDALFPFTRVFEFSGTAGFIEDFADDPVFQTELAEIEMELNKVFDWVFEGYPDRQVYARLSKINSSSPENAIYLLSQDPTVGDGSPYVIPMETSHRVNYLNLLTEMLTLGIGHVKREIWHDAFDNVKNGVYPEVIVVGNKFEAFAYGDLGNGICWNRLEHGIRMLGFSERQQRTDYIRAFPDEMTFFRFQDDTLYVDESLFPEISFDDGKTWITGNAFKEDASMLQVNTPMKMKIRYPFEPMPADAGTIVAKLKASTNCVLKDATIQLDEHNVGETQIVFKAQKASFKISESGKKYPFSVFSTSSVSLDDMEWLK